MITFSIIGYGHIGRRHAEHILQHPEASLECICDINPIVHSSIPDKVKFYTKETDFFQNCTSDIICICTPNHLHAPHAIKALNSTHHVIIEKPMALSTIECDEIIAASNESKKIVFAVKQNRYNPPVAIAKNLIEENKLGKIFKIQVNCFWNRNDNYYAQSEWRGRKNTDGGLLFTQFSHFIDILYYLVGDVDALYGCAENFTHRHNTEFEDTASFILKSKEGAIIDFNCTTSAYNKNMEGSITIFGENGLIKIGGQYLNTIEYSEIKDMVIPPVNITAKENDYGLYKGSMSNHDKVIQNAIDVLKNNAKVMTSAEEGKMVIQIIERMYSSIRS